VDVRLERAYEPALSADGFRVLIGHDPARFAELRRRYTDELATQRSTLRELRRRARLGTLTLVYAAQDTEHNDAVVLAELCAEALAR
jgi:uncharacterized protein YeaO (DUF488 family)